MQEIKNPGWKNHVCRGQIHQKYYLVRSADILDCRVAKAIQLFQTPWHSP